MANKGVQIFELAKGLGITCGTLIHKLQEHNVVVKNHMDYLGWNMAEQVKGWFKKEVFPDDVIAENLAKKAVIPTTLKCVSFENENGGSGYIWHFDDASVEKSFVGECSSRAKGTTIVYRFNLTMNEKFENDAQADKFLEKYLEDHDFVPEQYLCRVEIIVP